MLFLRKFFFYIFLIIYIAACPLIVLYAFGFILKPSSVEPIAKTGLIYLSTVPPGASIFLDDVPANLKTPNTLQDMDPADYTIKLSMDGYYDWFHDITVAPNNASVFDKILLVPKKRQPKLLLDERFENLIPLTGMGLFLLRKSPALKDWVVYSKQPFAGPERVLDYLGRYTHRVAIANHRIKKVESGYVTFRYRDRKNGGRLKATTLRAEEFIRRFLLHIVPGSFMRIRHFGFLANRNKEQDLGRCRELLGGCRQLPEGMGVTCGNTNELMLRLTGLDLTKCPCCQMGTMVVVAQIPKFSAPVPSSSICQSELLDSS